MTEWLLLGLFCTFYVGLMAWGVGLYMGERRAGRRLEDVIAARDRAAAAAARFPSDRSWAWTDDRDPGDPA